MLPQEYLICYGMFLGGQILSLLWLKIPATKKKFADANKTFSYKTYFKEEAGILIGSQIACVLLLAGWDQVIKKYKPEWADIARWVFMIFGAWGTDIAIAKWGSADKKVNTLLGIKANISDAMTGGTTTIKETIQAGKEVTGVDVTQSPKP